MNDRTDDALAALDVASEGEKPATRKAASRRKSPKAKRTSPTRTVDKAAPSDAVGPKIDLKGPDLYLNRELTWLAFNRRVLSEVCNRRTPLLERVKFLAIAASNIDEFFMKRIGGLKQQIGAGVHKLTVDGRTPTQQLEEC